MLKISIITAVRNSRDVIADCIRSVASQAYPDIEHIIVDGASTDGTLDIISKESGVRSQESRTHLSPLPPCASPLPPHSLRVISEPDDGIYDALNKGIRMATGDVIGFLHADDVYADATVIERVARTMDGEKRDSCYGDLVYVSRDDTSRVVRYWKSAPFTPGLLQKGWMPPHPTFFVRREVYEKCGLFDTSFRIAADYEMVLRLLGGCGISTYYIPEVLVMMRLGGASNRSISNILRKSREDLRAMKMHGMDGFSVLLRKNLSKLPQFFRRLQ